LDAGSAASVPPWRRSLTSFGVATREWLIVKYYFQCPNCGSDKQFIRPSEEASGLGCLLFLFGGFIPALLFADYTHRRVQCQSCGHIFRQPPIPSSPVAKLAGWLLAFIIISGGIAILLFSFPDLAALLLSIPFVATIEEAIIAQPRVAAYLLALLLVLIVVSCWTAACVSNARFRKRLSDKFHLKPFSSRELALRNGSQPGALKDNQNACTEPGNNASVPSRTPEKPSR
jgi:rubredoxin